MSTPPWPSQRIVQHTQQFRKLIEHVDRNDRTDANIDIDVDSSYLVIRSCGYLEQILALCVEDHVGFKASPRVASFAKSWLRTGRGLKPDELQQFLARLDPAWGLELKEFLEEDLGGRRVNLLFLYDRRNALAHGEITSLRRRRSLDLAGLAIELADWIIRRLDPSFS